MSIVRAGVYSALATLARLLFSLAIVKIVAWQGGPEGVGKLGQFLSLMSIVVAFAGGGISSGVIKYVSEYRNNAHARIQLLQAATAYTVLSAAAVAGILAILSTRLATWLLGDSSYRPLILLLGLAQFLIAGHNLIIGMLSGSMDARGVAIINIIGAAIGIISAATLAYAYGTDGTLYSLVIGQAVLLCISYPFFRMSPWYEAGTLRPRIDRNIFGLLARYSLMALTSAILSPLVQLSVRNHLATEFSWHDAGCWQAVSKLSEAYLLTITMAISMYYLPRLSSTLDKRGLIAEFRAAYLFFMPAVMGAAILIYIFRAELTLLLFSDKFLSSLDLFAPQLISDAFKIASFLLSYVMIAKAMTRLFIASEIAFSATYLCLVWLLTDSYGPIGAMYASAINYSAYLVFNIVMVRNYLNKLTSFT